MSRASKPKTLLTPPEANGGQLSGLALDFAQDMKEAA